MVDAVEGRGEDAGDVAVAVALVDCHLVEDEDVTVVQLPLARVGGDLRGHLGLERHPGWALGCHTTTSVHRQLASDGEVMMALGLVVIVVVVVVVVVTIIINNTEAVWVKERRTK